MDLISRAWLKEAIHNFFNGLSHKVTEEDIQAYIEATPSAFEGMTNGEAIISLYPNLKYTIRNGRVVTTIGVASSFDLEWWNAPYKGESE